MIRRNFIQSAVVTIAGWLGIQSKAPTETRKLRRYDYRIDPRPPFGMLIDLDTGEQIKCCYFFDETTGHWEQYVYPWHILPNGSLEVRVGKGRIRFYPFKDI